MTAHDWQPAPEHIELWRRVDRCTVCGAYRVRVRTEDGKRTKFTRYSPQHANIDDTYRWRSLEPGCKAVKEPQS